MSFPMVCFLLGLFSNKVVTNLFKVSWDLGLSKPFISIVVEDLAWEGSLGPKGVVLSVWSRWSMEVCEVLAVHREVFIVLICHCEAIRLGV